MPVPRAPITNQLTARTLLRIALYGALLFLFTRTYADADLWGHVRFGMDMVRDRAVPMVDPYSFTSDVRWVNHEWLAEVLMGAGYLAAGSAGLVGLKLLVTVFVAGVLIRTLRAAGWRGRHLDLVLTLALVTTFFRLQYMRPQLFSVLCFTGLLLIIRAYDQQRRWALWCIAPLFAFWVNTHGGFIVGLGVLGLWSVIALRNAGNTPARVRVATACVAAVAATLANPYGIGLWRFIWSTVGLSRPEILDWMPLWRFPPGILILELAFPIVAVAALVRARRLPPIQNIAIVSALGLLTFKVSRVDVFFHLSLAILALPCAVVPQAGTNLEESRRRSHPVYGVIAAALVVLSLAAAARNVGHIASGTLVPDRDALLYVRDRAGATRVLTWYDWGEYAIWHLSPRGIKVSMDGRRETVYSERLVGDHFKFYRGEKGFLDYPQRIGAGAVWLPADFPVIPQLLAAGWQTAYRSTVSVVLLPAGHAREAVLGRPDRGGAFPGP